MVRILTVILAFTVVAMMTPNTNASLISWTIALDGPSESPPNASPGLGSGFAIYDDVAHTLQVHVTFSGLIGNTTASHIHAATTNPFTGTAGVATTTPSFAGFPNGVTGATYDNTLDLTLSSSYNPTYVTNNGGTTATAETALINAMLAGKAYWNIHSTFAGGGEIRGFFPEPASMGLLGLAALMLRRRR